MGGEIFGWQKRSNHSGLGEALHRFDSAALKMLEPFVEEIDRRPAPKRLYHYTGDVGMHGVLQSGLLWFTDVFAMNDPSEIHHGMSHSARHLRDRVKQADSRIAWFFLERYEDFLKNGLPRSAHYNVCCFSSQADSLSQWRAYADDGTGYALGFNASAVETAYVHVDAKRASNRAAFSMTYDDGALRRLQTAIVDRMFDLIDLPQTLGAGADEGGAFLQDLSTLTSLHALHASLYFKHEAYRDESEYRFLTIEPSDKPLPGAKRRLRKHELVKYTEFNWWPLAKDALVEIVIGPAAPAGAEKFARDCLEAYSYPDVAVRRSQIPYRSP